MKEKCFSTCNIIEDWLWKGENRNLSRVGWIEWFNAPYQHCLGYNLVLCKFL